MKRLRLFGYAVISAGFLLTAWRGTLDWAAALIVATIFGMPGINKLTKSFLEWKRRGRCE